MRKTRYDDDFTVKLFILVVILSVVGLAFVIIYDNHDKAGYNKAIISIGDETFSVAVQKWSGYNSRGIVKIVAEDGKTYRVSAENVVLINETDE